MLSAVIAAFLHAVMLSVISSEVRFDVLALLIGGDLKTFDKIVSNDTFERLFQSFILYCFAITFMSVVAGFYADGSPNGSDCMHGRRYYGCITTGGTCFKDIR